jgi:D-alanine-D-alanine ligase
MKNILKSYHVPQVKYVAFYRNDYQLQPEQTLQKIVDDLHFPIFVKPANLGSSIGISRATNKQELENAIEVAAHYDSQIICEEGVDNLMEINCAVRGDTTLQESSLLEEPVTFEDFLTFEEKYINSGGTMQGLKSKVKIPAKLPEESMTEKIQDAAKLVFKALNCAGAARVDFLVDTKANTFYVNEINTIPGSLQAHLWEKSDVGFDSLLEGMIETALQREREKERNSFAFDSDILSRGSSKK